MSDDVQEMYTDGSFFENRRTGGWAVNIRNNGRSRIISGQEQTTGNTRMELLAVVRAVESAEGPAIIFTDMPEIVKRGNQVIAAGEMPSKDRDLWRRFAEAMKGKEITLRHLLPEAKQDNEHHTAAHDAAREAAMRHAGDPPTQAERIAFTREAGQVKRGHTYFQHGEDTVAGHTYNMLNLLAMLHPDPTVNLMQAVLWHDAAERFTGDIPSPAKQMSPDLKKAARRLEQDVENHYGICVDLSDVEKGWVKGIDKLEYLLWCKEQEAMGNTYVTARMQRMKVKIDTDPEIPAAIKEFAKGGITMCGETPWRGR